MTVLDLPMGAFFMLPRISSGYIYRRLATEKYADNNAIKCVLIEQVAFSNANGWVLSKGSVENCNHLAEVKRMKLAFVPFDMNVEFEM